MPWPSAFRGRIEGDSSPSPESRGGRKRFSMKSEALPQRSFVHRQAEHAVVEFFSPHFFILGDALTHWHGGQSAVIGLTWRQQIFLASRDDQNLARARLFKITGALDQILRPSVGSSRGIASACRVWRRALHGNSLSRKSKPAGQEASACQNAKITHGEPNSLERRNWVHPAMAQVVSKVLTMVNARKSHSFRRFG